MNERIDEWGQRGSNYYFCPISQAHDKNDGMLMCEAIFSRIGLLNFWVSPEQQGVLL